MTNHSSRSKTETQTVLRRYVLATLFASATVGLFLGGVTAGAQTGDTGGLKWREFKSEAGNFSIKFPGIPKVETADVQRGPMTLTRHVHVMDLNDISFEVDYIDLTAGADPDGAMAGGVSGLERAMAARGAKLLSEENVTQGDCAGREITFSTVNAASTRRGYAHARLFSSGTRFFTLILVAAGDTPAIREIARTFVESFTIIGGCTTAIAPVEAPPSRATEEPVEGVVDPASGWRVIESKGLGVRILMPGVTRHLSELAQLKPFPLMHDTYIYSDEAGVYSVEIFGDYPQGFHTTPSTYQTSIDIALYALKKNLTPVGFELGPLRDLRLASFPGREFSLTNTKLNSRGRLQIYVTETRNYVLMAFTRNNNSTTQVDKFFASVRLSPK